jgi:hypothetical protein
MTTLTIDQFRSQLSMLLRDLPRGTTAEVAEWAIAWWDGRQLAFAFLRDDGSGAIEEEFDLDDYVWPQWQQEFAKWVAEPRFSVRAELIEWLKDSPPYEAG